MKASLAGATGRGQSFSEWRKGIDGEFEKAGVDKLGAWHIQTIFRTNSALAFSAAQIAALEEVKGQFPYWEYVAVMDNRTRPEHRILNGKVFKMGEFFYYPPLGFNCRCQARPLTERQFARKGYNLSPDGKRVLDKDGKALSVVTPEERTGLKSIEFIGTKTQNFKEWADEKKKSLTAAAVKAIETKEKALFAALQSAPTPPPRPPAPPSIPPPPPYTPDDLARFKTIPQVDSLLRYYKQKSPDLFTLEEEVAIRAYTGDYASELNTALNEKQGAKPTDVHLSFTKILNAALHKLPSYNSKTPAIRMVDFDQAERERFNAAGNEVPFPGFTSSSYGGKAATFGGRSTVLKILTKAGGAGHNVTKYSLYQKSEKEILFKAGTVFRVVKPAEFVGGKWRITVEEIVP